MHEYKIRVLVRNIEDEREWLDKGADTTEIKGVFSSEEGDRTKVTAKIMEAIRSLVDKSVVNDGTG